MAKEWVAVRESAEMVLRYMVQAHYRKDSNVESFVTTHMSAKTLKSGNTQALSLKLVSQIFELPILGHGRGKPRDGPRGC